MRPVSTFLLIALSCALQAQILDPTFGTGGIAIHDLGAREVVLDAQLAPDGRIYVVGIEDTDITNAMLLACFLPDGQLDPAFGTAGVVITTEPSGSSRGVEVELQPDGKILVGAQVFVSGTEYHMMVRRFLPNGTLDASFGTGGEWRSNLQLREETYTMSLRPDGKILIAGKWANPWPQHYGVVYCVNADGTTDTSFGTNGAAQLPYQDNWPLHSLVQPDNKLVVSGIVGLDDAIVVRLNTDGSLDTGFATDGALIINTSIFESGEYMVQRPDGKILLGTVRSDIVGETYLYLIDTDGTLLPYGGSIGVNIAAAPDWYLWDLKLDATGKVLLVGESILGSGNEGLLVRAVDGVLDNNFATDGSLALPITDVPRVRSVMERQDGRLVTVGWGANTVIDAEDIWLVQYTSVPVGIEEGATRGAFSIAPNPVDRFFTITRNVPFDARTRVVVHDALGREVIAPFSVTQNSIDVDAASLTPGAYILTLHTSTGTSTQRLVKH